MMLGDNGVQQRSDQHLPAPQHKRVYADALLSEWMLISNYSPEDFGYRFMWPQMEPELSLHFGGSRQDVYPQI